MKKLIIIFMAVCACVSAEAVTLASLQKAAFNENGSMIARWRAVTSAGRIYGPRAEHFLQKAMLRPEWFLRDAAVVVSHYGERKWAIRWSKILLDDPALVVRTAAVDSLRRLHAKEARAQLWQKLYASENYRHGDSLWIRKNIVQALSEMATPSDKAKFTRLLADRDTSLRLLAKATLRRLR